MPRKTKKDASVKEVYAFERRSKHELPLFVARISAGFPSPADDYIDRKLDLNELIVAHPAATFFVKVEGDSMTDAGVRSGDILVVDRAVEAAENRIIIAALNGELTVKRFSRKDGKVVLSPANPRYKPVEVPQDADFEVWGVVTYIIHKA